MKLKIKLKQKPKIKQQPKEGDIKEKIKFAFLPVRINDTWVWMEKYTAFYKYKKYFYEVDITIDQGIIFERYRTETRQELKWQLIEKKMLL